MKTAAKRLLHIGRLASWRFRLLLGFSSQSRAETYQRLVWLDGRVPRFKPGEFRFPFGVFHYNDVRSMRYQYQGIFINGSYDFPSDTGRPNIIDCGGSIGLSVAKFKSLYPDSNIRVYEADPDICRILKMNVNNAGYEGVSVRETAIALEEGEVLFQRDLADAGKIGSGSDTIKLPSIRLSREINENIDLLKLNIEGAEFDAIHDLCVSKKIEAVKLIICQVHDELSDRSRSLARILNLLEEAGFRVSVPDARIAFGFPGPDVRTPFPYVEEGRFLATVYAWREGSRPQ